jgi:hypothetical protein
MAGPGWKAAPKKAEPDHPRWPTYNEITAEHDRRMKLKGRRI